MKVIALVFSLVFLAPVYAGNCDTMYPHGKPVVKTSEQIAYLCRRLYVVEHSPSRHTPYWAAERLEGRFMNASAMRINAFKADPDLPTPEAAKPSDYDNTGYDQGHMAPVGNMHIDPIAMLESFYMSNMVPQFPMNNRTGWRGIEEFTRNAAVNRGMVFVITGPIYRGVPKTIGKTKVAIPTHLFKIIYDPVRRESISFLVLNTTFYDKDIPAAISNIRAIESMAKIRFFPALTTPITESKTMWGR